MPPHSKSNRTIPIHLETDFVIPKVLTNPQSGLSAWVNFTCAKAVWMHCIHQHGIVPYPVPLLIQNDASILSTSNVPTNKPESKAQTQQHKRKQKLDMRLGRLKSQITTVLDDLREVVEFFNDRIQEMVLSCGSSFTRPRYTVTLSAFCGTKPDKAVAADNVRLQRAEHALSSRLIRTIMHAQQHPIDSTASPNTQAFVTLGIAPCPTEIPPDIAQRVVVRHSYCAPSDSKSLRQSLRINLACSESRDSKEKMETDMVWVSLRTCVKTVRSLSL